MTAPNFMKIDSMVKTALAGADTRAQFFHELLHEVKFLKPKSF
jgi:hypothetical protein